MSRVTPRLLGRFGPTPLIVVGTIGLAASFAWLSTLGTGDTYPAAVFGPMLLNGLSAGLVFMPVTSIVLGGVEPEHAGAASGLLQTIQQLGGAVGLAVIVSVYAAGAVPGSSSPAPGHAFLTSATFAGARAAGHRPMVRTPGRPAAPARAGAEAGRGRLSAAHSKQCRGQRRATGRPVRGHWCDS